MLLLGVQFLNSFAFGSLTSLFVFSPPPCSISTRERGVAIRQLCQRRFGIAGLDPAGAAVRKPPMMIAMGLLISACDRDPVPGADRLGQATGF